MSKSKYLPQIKESLEVNDFVEIFSPAVSGHYCYGKIISVIDIDDWNGVEAYMVLLNTYYSTIEQYRFLTSSYAYTFHIRRQITDPKIIEDIKFNFCLDHHNNEFKAWELDHLIFDNFKKEAGKDE